MENIKDFILAEVKNTETAPKVKKPSNTSYSIVSVSGPDFIIRKKTSRASKVLVIIVSQKQFYIKTENTGAIEKLTTENYKSFFEGITEEDPVNIVDEDGNKPYWIDQLCNSKKFRDGFFTVLSRIASDSEFFMFITNNYLAYNRSNFCSDHIGSTPHITDTGFKKAKTVHDVCVKHLSVETVKAQFSNYFGNLTNQLDSYSVRGLLEGLFRGDNKKADTAYDMIEEKWGIEGIRQFVDMYLMCPINQFPDAAVLKNLFEHTVTTDAAGHSKFSSDKAYWRNYYGEFSKYNKEEKTCSIDFNLKDFIRYIFCSGVEQGFEEDLNNFWDSWIDMLNMQLFLYGKVKDKYPENLASDEKRITTKVSKVKRLEDAEKFAVSVAPWEKYEYKGMKYRIVIPKTPDDMIAEGQMQSNCVASYISNVNRGDCMIFFMRTNAEPEKSLVTIEVRKDMSLGQVKAKFNEKPSAEQMDFVQNWYQKMYRQASDNKGA